MPQIIPIRDLKNTSEVSEMCRTIQEPIFVTKNGYGVMVIMNLEKYSELTDGFERVLDEADYAAEMSDVRYTHEEVFSRLRTKKHE